MKANMIKPSTRRSTTVKRASRIVAIVLSGVALVGLTGCASDTAAAGGPKEWTVDSSGWWVPSDPVGCLTQTVECQMAAAKTRAYKKGNIVMNVVTHGDVILLECKAPAPAPIFNSIETYTKYWYYTKVGDAHWWMPDIYVARDDAAVADMAAGVPDCAADVPGVNG